MRQIATFPLDDLRFWKKQLLHWAAGHDLAVYLDSNGYGSRQSDGPTSSRPVTTTGWECLVAAGAVSLLEVNAGNAFDRLIDLQNNTQDWLFGFFGYDLKNETERLFSRNPDGVGLPDMGFFRPETVVGIRGHQVEIQTIGHNPDVVLQEIKTAGYPFSATATGTPAPIELKVRMPKGAYLETVEAVRRHIVEGDLYEMNLCQEFFAENAGLDPVAVFEHLNEIGKAPFSTFMRWRDRYLLSASPERFLKKEGQKLISQPIKGTRRRSAQDDNALRRELAESEKDRAENVMIVDLVRNDLARNCVPGTVKVEELFGIYTFETVHQMISTVSGILKNAAAGTSAPNPLHALRDAFPPGSMTGAPKVMAMELIEQYERSRRGLYSGAIGYIDPTGDFDFNVVIRSILYNAADRYVSVQVGGAIVFDSLPEEEYEECLVKAEAMLKALKSA